MSGRSRHLSEKVLLGVQPGTSDGEAAQGSVGLDAKSKGADRWRRWAEMRAGPNGFAWRLQASGEVAYLRTDHSGLRSLSICAALEARLTHSTFRRLLLRYGARSMHAPWRSPICRRAVEDRAHARGEAIGFRCAAAAAFDWASARFGLPSVTPVLWRLRALPSCAVRLRRASSRRARHRDAARMGRRQIRAL